MTVNTFRRNSRNASGDDLKTSQARRPPGLEIWRFWGSSHELDMSARRNSAPLIEWVERSAEWDQLGVLVANPESNEDEPRFTVLDRAVSILRVYRPGESALSLTEIAKRTGLPKSSTHRYVQSLVNQNFLATDREGEYRLGVLLWEIGAIAVQARLPLKEIEPYADEVAAECGETCHVGILDGADVVYIVRVAGPAAVSVQTRLGQRVPAHATATGKAILAWTPPEIIGRHLIDPLKMYTDVTPSTVIEVLAEAEQTRRRGYAANTGGWQSDMRGVAAPILDHDGVAVASIGIAGPAYRLSDERMAELGPYIRRVAATISERLGSRPQPAN